MAQGPETQRWFVAILGHSGNRSSIFEERIFGGMSYRLEMQS